MDTLKIAADRASHYSSIAGNISSISSRMAALSREFASVAPRAASDEAWIDLLIASASAMLETAAALQNVEYVPPVVEPTVVDPDPAPEA